MKTHVSRGVLVLLACGCLPTSADDVKFRVEYGFDFDLQQAVSATLITPDDTISFASDDNVSYSGTLWVPAGKSAKLVLRTESDFLPLGTPESIVHFQPDLPNCYTATLSADTGEASVTIDDNTVYMENNSHASTITIEIGIQEYRGTLKTDACNDTISADGFSTMVVQYEFQPMSANDLPLNLPLTWNVFFSSSEVDAVILSTEARSLRIRAPTVPGSARVRATDSSTGCYVEIPVFFVKVPCTKGKCTAPAGPASFGSIELQVESAFAQFGLGTWPDSSQTAVLYFRREQPNASNYDPASLTCSVDESRVTILKKDGQNYIYQVKVPQGLVEINPLQQGGPGYEIQFFVQNEVGAYEHGGANPGFNHSETRLASYRIDNPEPANNNKIRITANRDGQSAQTRWFWWSGGRWRLYYDGGPKALSIQQTWSTNGNPILTERHALFNSETNCNDNINVVQAKAKKWEIADGMRRLKEETFGTDEARVTTYSYYTNGLLQTVSRWDGSWETRVYDTNARLTALYTPLNNQSATTNAELCRVLFYDYSTNLISGSTDAGMLSPTHPRRTIEKAFGTEVGRSYWVFLPGETRQIVCTEAGRDWDHGSNLVTTYKFFTTSNDFGKPKSVAYPDGRMTFWEYLISPGTNTTIAYEGEPGPQKTSIVNGMKTVMEKTSFGEWISRSVYTVTNGTLVERELYSNPDDLGRPQTITYLDGTTTLTEFNCCGQKTFTDRDGVVTTYTYDSLDRNVATIVGGLTSSNIFDAADNLLASKVLGTNAQWLTMSSSKYDTAGFRTMETNAMGEVTTFSETTSGPHSITTTYPDQNTRIDSFTRDGTLSSISGSGAHGVRYTNGVENGKLYTLEFKAGNTNEWVKTLYDAAGRVWKTVYPGNGERQISYSPSTGLREWESDPDGVYTYFGYNGKAELETNSLGGFDLTQSRMSRTVKVLTNNADNVLVYRTSTYAWNTSNTIPDLVGFSETSLNGLLSWTMQAGKTNHVGTSLSTNGSGQRYVTNRAPDGTITLTYLVHGRVQWITNVFGTTTYSYDPWQRINGQTDPRGLVSSYVLDKAGRVTTNTLGGQSTQFGFNHRGQVVRMVFPDGTSQTNTYTATGELQLQAGSRIYPVEYGYDHAGRLSSMKTWQVFSNSGMAITSWGYDTRGFLTNKTYADGSSLVYTYTPAGRLATRKGGRGIISTNVYNSYGDLWKSWHVNEATPGVTNEYTRSGLLSRAQHHDQTLSRSYDTYGRQTLETINDFTTSNRLNNVGQRTSLILLRSMTTNLLETGYDYVPGSGQLKCVTRSAPTSNSQVQATYSHLANSPLVEHLTFTQGADLRMTVTKAYDGANRLTSIVSRTNNCAVFSFEYQYNSANQRTNVTVGPDNCRWG